MAPSRGAVSAASAEADVATGCLLGHMIGDALGTCCEGWDSADIEVLATQLFPGHGGLMWDFYPCIHMGHHLGYTGPAKFQDKEHARSGMYSDDTNAALALAQSLVDHGGLHGPSVAKKYADFYFDDSCPMRFCPRSAQVVLGAVRSGVDYTLTGKPPHCPFKDGSYANGGAMRASPIGVAFREASPAQLRAAAEEAIRSSHVHPEAVDGAALQAGAVAHAARFGARGCGDVFCPLEFVRALSHHDLVYTLEFRRRLAALSRELSGLSSFSPPSDQKSLERILAEGHPGDRRAGSGMGFQIAALDMMPCVLWIAARYHSNPEEAIMRAISIGGDTDTCACMVGAIVGALHGTAWIPERWWIGLENGTRGRDFAVKLAGRLSELSLLAPLPPESVPRTCEEAPCPLFQLPRLMSPQMVAEASVPSLNANSNSQSSGGFLGCGSGLLHRLPSSSLSSPSRDASFEEGWPFCGAKMRVASAATEQKQCAIQ